MDYPTMQVMQSLCNPPHCAPKPLPSKAFTIYAIPFNKIDKEKIMFDSMFGDSWKRSSNGNWTWHGRAGWSVTAFMSKSGVPTAAFNSPDKEVVWIKAESMQALAVKVRKHLEELEYDGPKREQYRPPPRTDNLLRMCIGQLDDLELKRMRGRNHPDTAKGEFSTELYQMAVEEIDRRRKSA